MNADNARILVIGAGVNGSACASVLHNGGIDVTVLARGKRYEEVRNDGIIIEKPFNKRRTITRVRVIDSLRPNDLYDYILVVVRKNQIAELLPLLARNKSPNVVFMGNTLTGAVGYTQQLGPAGLCLASSMPWKARWKCYKSNNHKVDCGTLWRD